MYYKDDNNRTGKRIAFLVTLCYVAGWVLMLIYISFTTVHTTVNEGITIDFGDSEQAVGTTDLSHSEETQVKPVESKAQPIEELVTQQVEEAPEVAEKQISAQVVEEEEVVKPREVNKRALFKGSTSQSTSQSEGSETGTGNQGHQLGTVGGEQTGTAQSKQGDSFDLRGRNLIGELPQPQYGADAQGRVIVRIVVAANGSVSSASFQSSGSTTDNPALIDAALQAARKAKFNTIDALTPQQGTITYLFSMR